MRNSQTSVAERHAALRALYRRQPDAALIVKRVQTGRPMDREPSHSTTVPENLAHPDAPYGVSWELGLDEAVGGLQDGPNPGEMLCAALAACQEGLLRMMASALGVGLDKLEVTVTGCVDARGTLDIDPDVRVGFESMRMEVRLQASPGTPTRLLERLRLGGERLCVTLDTLRSGVPVEVCYDVASG
ncbi:OsmC family protein [Intrasporangium sp.]|uniref:OsmC family protein n=1 Tax=Intrasporangium sp. TaxID=1925024 RepID=UPI0032214116